MVLCINPPPEREQFELWLRDDLYERGEQKLLARYLRKDSARISRQFDPHREDAISAPYQFIEWVWATDCFSRTHADRLIERVASERRMWLAAAAEDGANVFQPRLSAAQGNRNILHEFSEFLEQEQLGAELSVQIRELEDVERAVVAKLDVLRSDLARQKASGAFARS